MEPSRESLTRSTAPDASPSASPARTRVLVGHFAAYFRGRLAFDDGNPVIMFDRGIDDAQFRGLQRALLGRYRLAWERCTARE